MGIIENNIRICVNCRILYICVIMIVISDVIVGNTLVSLSEDLSLNIKFTKTVYPNNTDTLTENFTVAINIIITLLNEPNNKLLLLEFMEDIPSSPFYLTEIYKNNEKPRLDFLHKQYKIKLKDIIQYWSTTWNYTLYFKSPILSVNNRTLVLQLPAATLLISTREMVDANNQKQISSNTVNILLSLREPNESLVGPIISATLITTVIWLLFWTTQNRFVRNIKLHYDTQEMEYLALKEEINQASIATSNYTSISENTVTVNLSNSTESVNSEPKRFLANKDRKHYKPKFIEDKTNW